MRTVPLQEEVEMEMRGAWQYVPRMEAVSNARHSGSLPWPLRVARYSRKRSKEVCPLFPREDKELAERRRVIRVGPLTPCWNLVGIYDVIECLLEGSLMPSFHVPGEHPVCWVTDPPAHLLRHVRPSKLGGGSRVE